MHDSPNDHFHDREADQSLDDRRPRFLRDIVGQETIVERLQQAARSGHLPHLRAFIGPSGSGKTTLATVTARMQFCPRSAELGDACGLCQTCRLPNLDSFECFHEWTGAELEQNWSWWTECGTAALSRPGWILILDEAQDLSRTHQKALFRQLERAIATVILATTHRQQIVDALLNRFGANVFEVRRPTTYQAVDLMTRQCNKLGVRAARPLLSRAAEHYVLDLRKCIDLIYTARDQTPDRTISDAFLDLVLGTAAVPESCTPKPNRLPAL